MLGYKLLASYGEITDTSLDGENRLLAVDGEINPLHSMDSNTAVDASAASDDSVHDKDALFFILLVLPLLCVVLQRTLFSWYTLKGKVSTTCPYISSNNTDWLASSIIINYFVFIY